MNQIPTNEEFSPSVRKMIVSTARSMLDGKISFLLGARLLAPLRPQTDAYRYDEDFMVFVAISSQINALSLDPARDPGDQHALAQPAPEVEEAEQWASTVGANACKSLIARFGEYEPNR